MTDAILHENENYQIEVNDDYDGYKMTNRVTGVVEEEFTQLPSAISIAEQCNAYLVFNTWQWIRKQEETQNTVAGDHLGGEDVLTH